MSFLEFLKELWGIASVMLGGIAIGALMVLIVIEGKVIVGGIVRGLKKRKEK